MKIEIKVKKIYTVIPFFDGENEVNKNYVRSFTSFEDAEDYAYTLGFAFDIVENDIEL
jgi:hypothetical protein